MPISPKYCLLLVCSSVRKSISAKLSNPPANVEIQPHIERLNQFVSNLKRSETVKSLQDNVIFANSLQVVFAERFLYSQKKNFNLPKEMSNDFDINEKVLQFL